ncbi:MAG: hypothetical protein AABX23_02335 [Nanoarchaeota archaeon]
MSKVAFGLFFLVLVLVPFVSAQYYGGGFWYGTEQVIDSIVQNLEPIFRVLLGGNDWTGYLLFEKILLFILISIIVGVILGNLPFFQGFKHKGILRLVAIIIGLLGVRNLNYIWIGTILVQYQVLFIAIAGILPFMIYWYFVKDLDGWLRKMAWVFYAVIYFGLWATTELTAYSEVYLWGAIGSLIYAFIFDTWVSRWLELNSMRKGNKSQLVSAIANISEEVARIERLLDAGHYRGARAENIAKEQIKKLEKRATELQKGL